MTVEAAAEYVSPDTLTPWSRNPRHNDDAVEGVAASIVRFGFAAPIIARRSTREVIAGHTRLKAAQMLGLDKVPVRFVDLGEEEAHALALADNKLGEFATWDDRQLADVLADMARASVSIEDLGWSQEELEALLNPAAPREMPGELDSSGAYTTKVKSPVYTPKGESPPIDLLVDRSRTDALRAEIDAADIPDDVRAFLVDAAERHTVFHFRRIAEFYCHASPEVQRLMERSALVIIDFEKAIENGFVTLTRRLGALADASGFFSKSGSANDDDGDDDE